MTQYVKPTAPAFKKILAMLFGNELKVTVRSNADLVNRHGATFVADDGELVALCACDKEFVGYTGAALTMVPGAVAREMVAKNEFNEMVLGSFYEVMNICSRLLMSESSPHLRLDTTLPPQDAAEAISRLEGSAALASFDVEIPRYGSGSVIFMVS